MKNNPSLLLLLLLWFILPVSGQQVREAVLHPVTHSAGSSMAYEYVPQRYTPAPKGFKPFYINHVGRHGSRNHTSKSLFQSLSLLFADAHKNGLLTNRGEELRIRIDSIHRAMDKRWGDLTPVGVREQKQIANRMYENYPEVFSGSRCTINAKSTLVPRCILSMGAFCESLKELAPKIDITQEASEAYMYFMNYYSKEYRDYYDNGPWIKVYDQFLTENIHPERLIASLFKNGAPETLGDPKRFMTNLFSAASILQDTELGLTLYDMFTDDEIYALWQTQNLSQYLRKGPSAIGGELALSIAKPLLRDFLTTSQNAVQNRELSANLRFAHGEQIMPFAALLGIEGASSSESDPDKVAEVWNDFQITSMAANIQWIFYRNAAGKVLIKILLNERETKIPVKTDIAPYYNWDEVLAYYTRVANQ